MFEIPECVTIAGQMADHLSGKRIHQGTLGNSPHKFVWYNRKPDEFAAIVEGKVVGAATTRGRWIFVPIEPGYILVLGECGGKILLHEPQAQLPGKYHLSLHFADGSALTATTQMWGAMELYEQGQERKRQYIKDMRTTPAEAEFTFRYFAELVRQSAVGKSRSVKSLLTQDQLIPGLGNAIAQDIMFRAGLHPKLSIANLNQQQLKRLHHAIVSTVHEAIERGGRNDEIDLLGRHGGYIRMMDKTTVGQPCRECGTKIEKIAYLGGACYFCPTCQAMQVNRSM